MSTSVAEMDRRWTRESGADLEFVLGFHPIEADPEALTKVLDLRWHRLEVQNSSSTKICTTAAQIQRRSAFFKDFLHPQGSVSSNKISNVSAKVEL